MDKLNINNLFNQNEENYNVPLDIKSLFGKTEKPEKINFSIEKLLINKKKKKLRVKNEHIRIYGLVLKKIMAVNNTNSLNMIYDVPEFIFGLSEYDSLECLLYIENKLQNLYSITTYKLSKKNLFISWKDVTEKKDDG
jgi:hypothetical protein